MSSELQLIDRANTGLGTYYALVTDDRAPNILINADGTRVDFTTATNAIIRAAARPMFDTGHPGFYFADFGVAANGRYRYSVFVTPIAPASAHATTTDQLAPGSEPEIIDWIDGDVAPAAGAGNMSLTTARDWITRMLRSGGSASQYDATDKDIGLITVCEQFARVTRCIQVAADVALTADSDVADVSGLTLFAPEQILSAQLSTVADSLDLSDYEEVHRLQIECPRSGKPEKLAFETSGASSGIVYPTPDVDYTLRVKWWQSFTIFTPGTGSADSITFNLPDRFLPQILSFGAPATIQHNHPEHGYMGPAWAKYLEYEKSMMGAGNRGAKVLVRRSVRDVERHRRFCD